MIDVLGDAVRARTRSTRSASIVDDDTVGYALETQTRPVYSRVAGEGTVVSRAGAPVVRQRRQPGALAGHLAQRGLGDLRRVALDGAPGWRHGAAAVRRRHGRIPADDQFWAIAVADPGPLGLFSVRSTTAVRRPCTRCAVKIGDEAFFAGARLWLERYDDGTATTADFQEVYEEVSGQDLDKFFDVWLRTPAKPTTW